MNQEIYDFIEKNPKSSITQISAKLNKSFYQIKLGVNELLADNKLLTQYEKRGTMFYAVYSVRKSFDDKQCEELILKKIKEKECLAQFEIDNLYYETGRFPGELRNIASKLVAEQKIAFYPAQTSNKQPLFFVKEWESEWRKQPTADDGYTFGKKLGQKLLAIQEQKTDEQSKKLMELRRVKREAQRIEKEHNLAYHEKRAEELRKERDEILFS